MAEENIEEVFKSDLSLFFRAGLSTQVSRVLSYFKHNSHNNQRHFESQEFLLYLII